MAVGDAHVFPGFLTSVLTQLFSLKPPTTFLTCLSRGERRKYPGKTVLLNSHQVMSPTRSPPSHPGGARLESDTAISFFMSVFYSISFFMSVFFSISFFMSVFFSTNQGPYSTAVQFGIFFVLFSRFFYI